MTVVVGNDVGVAGGRAAASPADPPPGAAGTGLRLVECNILGADHARGERLGGPLPARTRRAASVLPRGDLAVTQEDTVRQQRLLAGFMRGYDSVPTQPRAGIDNVVYYRTDRFERLEGGYFTYPGNGDPGAGQRHDSSHGVVVRLMDRVTGTVYVVADAHFSSRSDARGSDRGGALKREVTARLVRKLIARDVAAHPEDVAVVAADTNSRKWLLTHQTRRTPYSNDRALNGHRRRLPDCVLTADTALLANALDLARHRSGSCPRAPHSRQFDEVLWVYLTPQPGVRYRAHRIFGQHEATISDHPPVEVDLTATG